MTVFPLRPILRSANWVGDKWRQLLLGLCAGLLAVIGTFGWLTLEATHTLLQRQYVASAQRSRQLKTLLNDLIADHDTSTGVLSEVCALASNAAYATSVEVVIGKLIVNRNNATVEADLLSQLTVLAEAPPKAPKDCSLKATPKK